MTSSSKPATGSTAAKKATTKAAAPVKVEPPKATKADPLADVSFMDDILSDEAPKTARPAAAATSTVYTAAADTSDALARARARRQQAGQARVQA
ncbi:MAG: hypothetical protein R2845_09540 [Thermomicrobiales bacterium]